MGWAPAARSSFVGRDAELRALRTALDQPGVVTLTGVPGIGKTRLALEVCKRLDAGWATSASDAAGMTAVFVSLADQVEAVGIRAAVAAGREARLRPDDGWLSPPAAGDPELLVLDNTEHLPGAAAEVRALLDEGPQLRILVTSVGPLGLDGEHVLRLGRLKAPYSDDQFVGHQRREDPAVGLFRDRATAASATFGLREEDMAVVGEFC